MDTLGNCEELKPAVEAAARKALHDWGRPQDDVDDLVQELWTWYFSEESARSFIGKANTATGQRNAFARRASQLLSKQQLEANVFRGQDLYSSDAVRAWLLGESTNKYLGKLIQQALTKLEDQNASHREAIRSRFEEGIIPGQGAPNAVMVRALRGLTSHVNALAIEARQGESKPSRGVEASSRRGGGGYSDPTADLAIGLINGGDQEMELHDGTTTTFRKEFEDADNIMAERYDTPTPPWSGIDMFEGELNDRTDMYRAQVFPDLYPDEQPMLLGNWHPEDLAAYCGGEYTVGYRRLKVVK